MGGPIHDEGGRRQTRDDDERGPPIIDLKRLSEDEIVRRIADACRTFGFFQITSHSISTELIEQFQRACQYFFTQVSVEEKNSLRRHQKNARGYFDDELTKQKLDWKQCLDVGVPGSRQWEVDDACEHNACLDGHNQFPVDKDGSSTNSQFRDVVIEYFEACSKLSHTIATYMARGLLLAMHREQEQQQEASNSQDNEAGSSRLQQLSDQFLQQLQETHTSYLRLNYYPPCEGGDDDDGADGPLGISPHKDAGFLTILLQDDDCHSLQVWDEQRHHWCTVIPAPNSLTINTGDMAQVWSNSLYKAPLHRVLTHTTKPRYSAPFFYNPGYDTWVAPIHSNLLPLSAAGSPTASDVADDIDASSRSGDATPPLVYHPVLWGYYRAVRFAGDLTDLGVEIQISDFEIERDSNGPSSHVDKQRRFAQMCDFRTAFSVETYRELLQE